MRPARSTTLRLHAQIYFEPLPFEADAASCGEVGRFGYLRNSEPTRMEFARERLSAGRHGRLAVFDGDYFHFAIMDGQT